MHRLFLASYTDARIGRHKRLHLLM